MKISDVDKFGHFMNRMEEEITIYCRSREK